MHVFLHTLSQHVQVQACIGQASCGPGCVWTFMLRPWDRDWVVLHHSVLLQSSCYTDVAVLQVNGYTFLRGCPKSGKSTLLEEVFQMAQKSADVNRAVFLDLSDVPAQMDLKLAVYDAAGLSWDEWTPQVRRSGDSLTFLKTRWISFVLLWPVKAITLVRLSNASFMQNHAHLSRLTLILLAPTKQEVEIGQPKLDGHAKHRLMILRSKPSNLVSWFACRDQHCTAVVNLLGKLLVALNTHLLIELSPLSRACSWSQLSLAFRILLSATKLISPAEIASSPSDCLTV